MAGYSVTYTVIDQATEKINAINKRIEQLRAPLERQQKSLAKFIDVSGLGQVAEGFNKIARGALSAFESLARAVPPLAAITGAASLAGMAKLADDTARWGAELARTADDIGSSPGQLHTWNRALTAAGGNVGDLTDGLKGLQKTVGDISTGRGGGAFEARMRSTGIALKDVNNNWRTSLDLLPDVLDYINQGQTAYDRMNRAIDAGSSSLYRVAQQYRLSGKSAREWLAEQKATGINYDELVRRSLAYEEAVGRLSNAFDDLRLSAGSALANAITPLINRLSAWLENPATQKQLNDLVASFEKWTQGPGPEKLLDNLKLIGDALLLLARNADIVAEIFIAKWGAQAVLAVGKLTTALGVAGGAGLLGTLGAVGAAAASAFAAWTLWKQGTGQPGSFTDPAHPQFGDPSIPAMPGPTPPAGAPAPAAPAGVPMTPDRRGAPLPGPQQGPPASAATPISAPAPAPAAGAPANDNQPRRLAAPRVPAPAGRGDLFAQRAGLIINDLQRDFGLTREQASGLVGNLGYESGGFKSLQEIKPAVAGSRGGYGYAQWTGARRKQFEAWAKEHKLDPASHEANVGFLEHELRTSYAPFLARLKQTRSIEEASRLSHEQFETPMDVITGTYASGGGRLRYARRALGLATGAPIAAPAGAPGANGAVDVNIRHTNPPAGSTVETGGSGNVNVAPVKTEWQDMAAVA